MPIFAEGQLAEGKGPVQLNLFQRPEQNIIDTLKKADIYGMTPLEALNYLAELHEKAKSILT